jgi:tyrosine-protein phosphatase YwqE
MANHDDNAVSRELRMLETIKTLIEHGLVNEVCSTCEHDPRLTGHVSEVLAEADDILHEQIMEGKLDLTRATGQEIEAAIREAVAEAVKKNLGPGGSGQK